MFKALFKRHSSGLMVCANGSVYLPGDKFHKSRLTFGSNGKYLKVCYMYKTYPIHVLVAETFLDNRNGKPTVDHIDRDKHNNQVENLRFADYKEQCANRSQADRALREHGCRQADDRLYYAHVMYNKHREHVRQRQREYYVAHRDEILAKQHARQSTKKECA